MVTYKKVIDRYCPNKEHNVKIEISHHDDGRITERCIHDDCKGESCGIFRKVIFTKRKTNHSEERAGE